MLAPAVPLFHQGFSARIQSAGAISDKKGSALYYDLHTHTVYSDGALKPEELVNRARAAGVRVLSLTDHDVTEGLPEGREAAIACGLVFINGVEISVTWSGLTVHVLGLGINPSEHVLQEGLSKLRATRISRAEEIGRRLAKKGIAGSYEGALSYAGGPIVSRTHFAQFLVADGRARDLRHAFKDFLKRGTPGHVPIEWATLEQAVGWICTAGGQAVIAHPARYDLSTGQLKRLLGEFKESGGAGIEVISGSHSRDDMFRFALFARNFGLLASAGSDYHGPGNAWIQLGHLPQLPPGCEPIWADWDISATQRAV